jgi:hypothetical protein
MTISKLGAALKAKFPGPGGRQKVARILGIDADVINGAATEPAGGNGGGNSDADLTKLRTDIEALLSEGYLSNRIHGSLRAELLDLLKRSTPSSVMADDNEDDEGRRFAEFLKEKGFDEADIKTAINLARGNGIEARDAMPANALNGGMGGALSGVRYQPRHYDLAADARLKRRFPGIENIAVDAAPSERRDAPAPASRPDFSRSAMEKFAKKYPDAARIC